MSLPNNNNKKTGIISTLLVCIVLIGLAALILIYRQRILDQINVWEYTPSAQVADLTQRAGMNDNGIFYYYASQPALYNASTAKDFNKVCNSTEITTAILGCYSGNKIYIYAVTDKRLDGISEVAAAHETLHAIYSRLSDSEKTRIDKLLEGEYKTLSKDKYYSDLLAFYNGREPGQRDNELHSIIGTEVANLNPELEAYYDQYFTNRQDVVNLDARYSNVFKSLKAKADNLLVQINQLSTTIPTLSNQYNIDAQKLKSDISSFKSRENNGSFSSQSQLNSEVAALNQRIDQLNTTRTTIQADIKNYQSQVAEYNSIATESKKLYETINSTLVSSPSV